jgi:hypothetical protein
VGVHRFLVTAEVGPRMDVWSITSQLAHWIEGRPNPGGGETWLVTCLDEHAGRFLKAAGAAGVTVEEIHGAGPGERYEMLVGEPGTGWGGL